MKETYQVYCHTNTINGKIYIGVTKNTWEDRWKTKYRSNQHFNRAILKYPEECWEHEVVIDGVSRENAAEWEKVLIEFYDARNPEHGYNKGRGGEGVVDLDSLHTVQARKEYHEALSEAMKRVWASRTPEERKKYGFLALSKEELSKMSKERWRDEEYRKNISQKQRELRKAKQMEREKDPEYVRHRKEAEVRKKERDKEYHRKHYIPVDSEEKHKHYSDAAKKVWEDLELRESASKRQKDRMSDPSEREKIRQARLGTVHPESDLMAISNGMKEKWKDPTYAASLRKPRPKRTNEQKEQLRKSAADKGKMVLCVETGTKYPSINEAARATGYESKHFKKAIRSGHAVRGYHYQIIGEAKDQRRKIACIDTGEEYVSLTDASSATGICISAICSVCCGRRKTAGGLRWKYVDED